MKRLAIPSSWLLAAAIACGDAPTLPAPPTHELSLSVCSSNTWVAYQNEGGPWTRLGGTTGGDVTIQATDRLALAVKGSLARWLFLYYISADQAQRVLGCHVSNDLPVRSLAGTVNGLTSAHTAQLSTGPYFTWLERNSTGFTFQAAASGTRDLFALRVADADLYSRVDRIIVRRAQAHADGTIPLLDFESSEAVLPAQHVLSWTAPTTHVVQEYLGADGNRLHLQSVRVGTFGDSESPRTTHLFAVPANLQVAGEVHRLNLFSDDRSVATHYQQPEDMTVTLGPPLMNPTFTTIATSPLLRVQSTLPRQPEYDGHLEFLLTQQGEMGPRNVTIIVTREHFQSSGTTPAAWVATIPDLSALGLPSGVGLEAGKLVAWSLTATSRAWGAKYFGAAGDVYRSASRHGSFGN